MHWSAADYYSNLAFLISDFSWPLTASGCPERAHSHSPLHFCEETAESLSSGKPSLVRHLHRADRAPISLSRHMKDHCKTEDSLSAKSVISKQPHDVSFTVCCLQDAPYSYWFSTHEASSSQYVACLHCYYLPFIFPHPKRLYDTSALNNLVLWLVPLGHIWQFLIQFCSSYILSH